LKERGKRREKRGKTVRESPKKTVKIEGSKGGKRRM